MPVPNSSDTAFEEVRRVSPHMLARLSTPKSFTASSQSRLRSAQAAGQDTSETSIGIQESASHARRIVLYGTGFGATQPPISATVLVPSALPLANVQDLRIRIGSVDAAIAFAGLISPGLYQFNVVVPQVPDGDQTIVAELRGLLTKADLMVAVQY